MSEREISPWPWRLWDETMGVQILDAEGNLICFVESTADAHMMVTSPELLAACEWMLEHCDQGGVVGKEPCDNARAAIAKARGEQP